MRKLLAFMARPIVWSTLGLGLLLLSLYVVCGLLHLDDSRWLVELMVSVPLTVFLIVYWLRRYLLDRRLARDLAKQARKQAAVAGPDALRDFKAFEDEFKRAFGELNDACRKRGLVGGAAALPWILVMGPPAVGKTTALDRSGLRFTSLGRRLHGIGPTRNCTWWLASDAIFLDTAGRYAVVDEDKQEWAAFLRLLQRRRRQPLDAVVLQVGLDEILDRSPAEIERAALLLRERLDEISDLLGVQTPVHILFNKCDLLDGFVEFFADLSDDERRQPWGFAIDMAQPTRVASMRERFDSGLDALVTSLRARLNSRLLVQGDRPAREAVLGFPDEVEALREPLRRFTEMLCGADGSTGRGEEPRVSAVYLASAAQTAERRSGMRHRLGADLGVSAGSLRNAPPQLSEGTFFLRGVFSHIIRQAEHAVRPSQQRLRRLRFEQQVAVAATAVACVAASWYLSRSYRHDDIWLDALQQSVADLRARAGVGPIARQAEDRQLSGEIEQQTQVLKLLAETGPYSALARPHKIASEILRRRMEEQWLHPLVRPLQQGLKLASETQHERATREFARDFRLLQAVTILHKRLDQNPQCQLIRPEEAEEVISGYLLEQWQRALGPDRHLLERSPEKDPDKPETAYGKLRQELRFMFQGGESLPKSSSAFDEALVRSTRDNLKSASHEAIESVFLMRELSAALYEERTDLRTDRIQDPGIEQVFTLQGCDRFFDKKTAAGKAWWSCLLDVDEPRDTVGLSEYYRQRYLEAWGGWLKAIALRPDKGKTTDLLTRTDETLDALTRPRNPELTQALQYLGWGRRDSPAPEWMKGNDAVGCMSKVRGTANRIRREITETTLPIECKQAMGQLRPFAQLLTPKPKDGADTSDDETGSGRSGELYSKLLDSGQKLHLWLGALRKMAPNKKPEVSLSLVQNTMESKGVLFDFDDARLGLMGDLRGRVERMGFEVQSIGLNKLLERIEVDVWVSILPAAARRLDDQWNTQVLGEWKLLKDQHTRYAAEDPETCPKILEFVTNKVKPFSQNSLAAFYEGTNPANCRLTHMDGPFAQPIPIDPQACAKIQNAIRIAGQTHCDKAMGAAGGVAKNKPAPTKADVESPLGSCHYNAISAQLDDGVQLHTCSISTEHCQHEASQEKRPRLSVKWSENRSYELIFQGQGDDYLAFLKRHGDAKPTSVIFEIPPERAPGNCKGIRVKFQVPVTAGGGGGAGGSGSPDNEWKKIELPTTLLHKER